MSDEHFWQATYRDLVWRAKLWHNPGGALRVDICPFYTDEAGNLRPRRGGFKLTPEEGRNLGHALIASVPPDA